MDVDSARGAPSARRGNGSLYILCMNRLRHAKHRVFGALLGLFLVFLAFDYGNYYLRYNAAIGVARRHGARVGSLLDWPLGRECCITFDKPVDNATLRELTVLNSLSSRHSVSIALNYELDDDRLRFLQETLRECYLFRSNAHRGNP